MGYEEEIDEPDLNKKEDEEEGDEGLKEKGWGDDEEELDLSLELGLHGKNDNHGFDDQDLL